VPIVACYRLDPGSEGVLMIGLDSDAPAKRHQLGK